MNKVTLSVAAIAALAPAYVQAEDLTQEQKDALIAAKKAAIDEIRIQLNAAANRIEVNCPDVKEEGLLELSKITTEMNKIYDDDSILYLTDAEKNKFTSGITSAEVKANQAQAPYNAKAELEAAYETLKNSYAGVLAEAKLTSKYPLTSAAKVAALQAIGVEAIGTKIAAYDPKETTILDEKAGVLTDIETATDKVTSISDNLLSDENAAKDNETAHQKVVDAYNTAKANYLTQSQEAIAKLPSDNYKDWQEAAVAELVDQYRIINDAKAEDDALYKDEKSATVGGKWKDVIDAANAEINNIVKGYVDAMQAQENLNDDYTSKIKAQQDKLTKIKGELSKRGLTECDADINAAQKLINDLTANIAELYAKHELKSDKYEKINAITEAVGNIDDNKSHAWNTLTANYDAKVSMEGIIANTQKALNDAKAKAATASKDGKYNAAARYTATANSIQALINSLSTEVADAYKKITAVSYQNFTFSGKNTDITTTITEYGEDTDACLTAYETAVKNAADAQDLLDKLVDETVTDENVTVGGELDGVSYATKISIINNDIKAITDAVAAANKMNDAKHKTAIEAAAELGMSQDIKGLTDSYADNKSVYDRNSAIKAADNVLAEAGERIKAFQDILDGVTGDLGNQADAINAKKDELQKKLDEVNATKTDAENTFNRAKLNDKLSDEVRKEEAAKAIAVLATVSKDLDDINGPLTDLDNAAKAAVANKKAYDKITAAITAASNKLDEVIEDPVNNYTQTAAFEYYRNTMKGWADDLAKVSEETVAGYAAITLADSEKDLTDRANLIKSNAEKFAVAVLANENMFANQVSDVTILGDHWTSIYNTVSDKDLSDKGREYLADLAKQLEKINTLKNTTVPEAYKNGKSVEQDEAIQAEIAAITAAIDEIAKASKDNYDANVDATNLAQHNDFLETYKAANKAFSDAVEALNQFSNIKNGALQTALDNLIETHDYIYAYADLLRDLKAKEDADYTKYVNDETDYENGTDDIYSAKPWIEWANSYKADINKKLAEYQDKVNQVAKGQFDSTVSSAETTVKNYEKRISNFVYSDKANAFKDVKNVIAEAKAAGAIDADGTIHDPFYAVKVDTWVETLSTNIYTMLGNDLAAACAAEYKKLNDDVTAVYEAEKKAIGEFAEIDNAYYLQKLENLKAATIDFAAKNYHGSDYDIENNVRPYIGKGVGTAVNYFGTDANTDHSDIYQEAFNLSAGNKANLEAYGRINSALTLVESDFNDIVDAINTLIVAHQASEVYSEVKRLSNVIKSEREEIEYWKMTGACVANEQVFNAFVSTKNMEGFPQQIDGLKNMTIYGEIDALNAIIDEVKEEYNQVAKKDLDLVKDYDAKIQGLYDAVAAIKTKYDNRKDDMFDGAREALLAQEAAIANINSELNAMYENTQIADAKAAIDTKLSNVDNALKQAEEWAYYNDATRALYQAEVDALRGEYELINADYEAKVEADQILIYKDALLFDLDNVANAVPGYYSALYYEYNKQLTNDNVYSQLKTQLETYSTSLEEAYGRINVFTHRKATNGQDLINTTYGNLSTSIKSYSEQLEKAHKNVTLNNWGDLNSRIDRLSSSIYNMEMDACVYEADGALNDVNASVSASNAIKDESLYGGNRAAELQARANEIGRLVGLAQYFNKDAQDKSIAYDIDGKDVRIKYDWSENPFEIRIDYLYEENGNPSAWSILSERIAKLQADAEQLAKDVVELAYIQGDADNDKFVTVNDYSEVRGWILTAKKFKDVSEAQRYAGDVNSDEVFTVADMTGISNIIFYNSVTGPQAGAPSRARAFNASADQLTVANESEETTIFGKTVRMAVSLDNAEAFTAGQMDIILPQGMKLAGQSLSSRANGHELLANEIAGGTYRLVASTVENNAFNGSNGALIYLDVEVGSDYNGGNITIDNVIFSDAQANSYYLTNNGPIVPTGIEGIEAASVKERIYSVGGQMMKAVKKGINIIVGENNNTKKVVK